MLKKLFLKVMRSKMFSAGKPLIKKIMSKKRYEALKKQAKKMLRAAPVNANMRTAPYLKSPDKYGVNIAGFFSSSLGLGESARNMVSAVETTDIPYVLNDCVVDKQRKIDTGQVHFRNDNPYCFNLIHINPDYFDYFLMDKGKEYLENRYNIGIWYWELERLPDVWVRYFQFFDEIWVGSRFVLQAVSFLSSVPVLTIPPCISLKRDPQKKRADFNLPETAFIFLFVFDFFSSMERKNVLSLIEAFHTAFKDTGDVILLLKSMNGNRSIKERSSLLKSLNGKGNIIHMEEYLKREELDSILSLSDCYVSLHRSEGFGLGIAEAMYYGKPVIVTGYSGNMDYTNVNNSFPVKYRLVELEEDHKMYSKGSMWAEPDLSHASGLMRFVFENRSLAGETAEKGRHYIHTHYSPEAVGHRIKNRLEIIRSYAEQRSSS